METNLTLSKDQVEPQYLISTNKFLLLSVLTFGLYNVWWFYKAWRFFGQLENKDLTPAIRAIFGIFFAISLFERILNFAKQNGYERNYSSTLIFIGYLLISLFGFLPDPFHLFGQIATFFLIRPFEALSYAVRKAPAINAIAQENFNARQVILIVIGSLLWVAVLLNTFFVISGEAIN